jgi:pSer/pThr/pTyr-binding forkhead associated (FHA) protein
MQPKLLITLNNSLISELILENEVTSIGRKSDNDIHIDNPAVSGKHARVLFMGGEAFLEDLESTNGTFVNSEKITKHLLTNGDLITIGQHQLKFEGAEAEEGDLEKTVVIKPYAVGMEGTEAFQAAALEKEQQQKDEAATAAAIAAGERPALLQLLSGANNGKKMALNKSITRLGKPGEQVAAIAKRPAGYFIMHLGGNTTQPIVNGNAVGTQAKELKHGDIIEVGKIRMKIMIPS